MRMGVDPVLCYVSVEFEVFGQVQGCGFTKHVRDLSVKNKIGGWVKNSKTGTIVGKIQGAKAEIDHMVDWLSNQGSPGCKIEKCELKNWGTSARLDYREFQIRF